MSSNPASCRRQAKCLERISINRPVHLIALNVIALNGDQKNNPIQKGQSATSTEDLKLVDLSNCGVGLLSAKPYQVNQSVALQLSLPTYSQTQQLTLNGLVKHATAVHNNYLIGCQLLNLSAHDQLVIKEFFAFHRRLQF